jgi:hypothetical protein
MVPATASSGEPQNFDVRKGSLTPKRLETPGIVNCVSESPAP